MRQSRPRDTVREKPTTSTATSNDAAGEREAAAGWTRAYSGDEHACVPKARACLFSFFAVDLHRHSGAKALATCTTRQLGKAGFGLPRADLTLLTSQARVSHLHRVFAAGRLIRPRYLVAIAQSEVLAGHKPTINLSSEWTPAAGTFTGHLSLQHCLERQSRNPAGPGVPATADVSPLSGDRLARLAGGEVGLSLSAGSYLFLLPLSAA